MPLEQKQNPDSHKTQVTHPTAHQQKNITMKATIVSAFLVIVLFCSTFAAPLSAESTFPELDDYLQKLKQLKKYNLPESIRYDEKLKTPLNRQIGNDLIQQAEQNFEQALANVNPDDPKSLIQLQIAAFLFTNTVQSVSGTLQSISSATAAAAQKVGQ